MLQNDTWSLEMISVGLKTTFQDNNGIVSLCSTSPPAGNQVDGLPAVVSSPSTRYYSSSKTANDYLSLLHTSLFLEKHKMGALRVHLVNFGAVAAWREVFVWKSVHCRWKSSANICLAKEWYQIRSVKVSGCRNEYTKCYLTYCLNRLFIFTMLMRE